MTDMTLKPILSLESGMWSSLEYTSVNSGSECRTETEPHNTSVLQTVGAVTVIMHTVLGVIIMKGNTKIKIVVLLHLYHIITCFTYLYADNIRMYIDVISV